MIHATSPTEPVENWEQVRDEWLAAIDQLFLQVEEWCRKRDWGTRRDPKKIKELELGTYEVPCMLIQTVQGRLLLAPSARFVSGALGVVDFCAYPSYDYVMIGRFQDGWFLVELTVETRRPWTEDVFAEIADKFLKVE